MPANAARSSNTALPVQPSDEALISGRSRVWGARFVGTASAVVIAFPFLAAIVAWRDGWMPFGDEAAVVAQSWGTFSTHPPLLGNYTSITTATASEQVLFHPGPLQLWLLAGPIHWFAPSPVGALIGSAFLVSASFAVVIVVAWRRGDWRWAGLVVVMLAWLIHSVGPQVLRSAIESEVSMFCLLAAFAAGWAALDGDDWFWPVAVVFVSISAQAEAAFTVPVATIAVVLAGARVAWWIRRRRVGGAPHDARRRAWAVALVTVVVGLGCWSGPLYDQFFGAGNLWRLVVAGGGGDMVGPGWGLNRLVDALGFPPIWMVGTHDVHLWMGANGRLGWHTPMGQNLTAAAFCVVFIWCFVRNVRRHDRRLVALGLVAVGGLAGAFVAASVTPNDPVSLIGHEQVWWVAGFVAWLFPLFVLFDWVSVVARQRARSWVRWGPIVLTPLACAALLFPLGIAASKTSPARDVSSGGYGMVARFANAGAALCKRHPGAIAVSDDGFGETLATLGVIAQLQLEGCAVHVDGQLSHPLLGVWFRRTGRERFTLLVSGSASPPPGYRQLSVYDPSDSTPKYRGFVRFYAGLQRSGTQYLYVRGT